MYKVLETGGIYRVLKDNAPLRTPGGSEVVCWDKDLAARLIKQVRGLGDDTHRPLYVVDFHYPYLDFGTVVNKAKLARRIAATFNVRDDWSLRNPFRAADKKRVWTDVFGDPEAQVQKGVRWVEKLSVAQLFAVSALQRYLESVNIPFIAASLPDSALPGFLRETHRLYNDGSKLSLEHLTESMENYLFYIGLEGHL